MGKRPTGVGRGNGAGSRATQFKHGEPSANPFGRPRKEKSPAPKSMNEAIAAELSKTVKVYEDGVPRRMTQLEAIARYYVGGFPTSTKGEQQQAIKYMASLTLEQPKQRGLDPEWARKLVERLAEEAKKDQENDRFFPTPPPPY